MERIEVLDIGSKREIRGISAYVAPLKRLTPASKGGGRKPVRKITGRKDDEKGDQSLKKTDCRNQSDMIMGRTEGNPCEGGLCHSLAELGECVSRQEHSETVIAKYPFPFQPVGKRAGSRTI